MCSINGFTKSVFRVLPAQIRNVETNQCLDNMARKENEKVGIFNCHGMGGNQVSEDPNIKKKKNFKETNCKVQEEKGGRDSVLRCVCASTGFLLHGQQRDQNRRLVSGRVQAERTRHDAQVPSPERQPALGVRHCGEWNN